jgi:outer membrane lipoprotein SlyB
MTPRMIKIAAATGVAGALALGGATWAIAGGGNDGSATGPGADQAKAAAIAALGGGTANAVERDNEDGATWEVEVTKSDGNTVDVRLDANYKVLVVDGDSETADDQAGAKDDQSGAQNEAGDG